MWVLEDAEAGVVCQPIILTTVSSQSQALHSAFPVGASLALGAGALTLNMTVVPGASFQPLPFCTELSVNGNSLLCRFDAALLGGLLAATSSNPHFAALQFETLPDDIQLALLQAALESLRIAWTDSGDCSITLIGLRRGVHNDKQANYIFLQCNWQHHQGLFSISVNDESLGALKRCHSLLPLQQPGRHNDVSDVPLVYSVEMGMSSLPWSDVAGLQCGDIVLVERRAEASRSEDVLLCGMQARLTVQGLKMGVGTLSGQYLEIIPMSEQTDSERSKDTMEFRKIEELELEVVFEVARGTTTLQQLKALALNNVFTLQQPPNATVMMVVNGKAIAEAELVNLDSQLGARITRLMLPTDGEGCDEDDHIT